MDKQARYLKNKTDGEFYPYTHKDAIVGDNGDPVELINADYIDEKLSALATKSVVKNATITSTLWTGDAAPYTATLSVKEVTADNIVEVILAPTVTTEQIQACMGASIVTGTQAAGSITLNAYGEKPTVDIPITVIVRGD